MQNSHTRTSIMKDSTRVDPDKDRTATKSAKFNEANVMTTYHPTGKDYGFMNIDEPKTPFVRNPGESTAKAQFSQYIPVNSYLAKDFKKKLVDVPNVKTRLPSNEYGRNAVDMEEVLKKLCFNQNFEQVVMGLNETLSDEDDFFETFEEKIRRLEFERRRKIHYTEYQTVALARRLIQEEFGDWKDPVELKPNLSTSAIPEEGTCEMVCEELEVNMGKSINPTEEVLSSEMSSGTLTPSHPCYGHVTDDD